MLNGIRLLGSQGNKYEVSMEIIDLQSDDSLIVFDGQISSVPLPVKQYKIDGFDILFDPFLSRRSNKYIVKAFIDGPNSCYGVGGMETVQCDGVVFHFNSCVPEKHFDSTDVSHGQFAEFLFKPM